VEHTFRGSTVVKRTHKFIDSEVNFSLRLRARHNFSIDFLSDGLSSSYLADTRMSIRWDYASS
jgi:hypothetical protein